MRSDRERDRLEKRAEDRDWQDLRTLERAQNILESAINRLAALPAIEWPNRRWTIADGVAALKDIKADAAGTAKAIEASPPVIEEDLDE